MRHLIPGILLSVFPALIAGLSIIGLGACGESSQAGHPQGIAEDLWGNKIDLSEYQDKPVFIHSFTTSNCGYCLLEGDFVHDNYGRVAVEFGGRLLGMCAFNPQLDIYAYQKHFRDDHLVLTGPMPLFSHYHGGYPGITILCDGRLLFKGFITPYRKIFDSLLTMVWPEKDIPLYPASPAHMGLRFAYENMNNDAVQVCPDSTPWLAEEMADSLEKLKIQYQEMGKDYQSCYIPILERNLTRDDYTKNLIYEGHFWEFSLTGITDAGPIKIVSDRVIIGDFSFPQSRIGLNAVMPNPNNPERYLILMLRGENVVEKREQWAWADYYIYGLDSSGAAVPLLYGFFEKDGPEWKYSAQLARGSEASRQYCKGGACPVPYVSVDIEDSSRGRAITRHLQVAETTSLGPFWSLGEIACHFPDVMAGDDGTCLMVWEEQGDILLADLGDTIPGNIIAIDDSPSDSYNPILARDNDAVWIYYLDDRTRFYRLYARTYDGGALSPAIMINENEPIDALTPSVAYNDGASMVILWSEQKANQRFLMWREIRNRVPGEIRKAAIKTSDGYSNAWYPSIAIGDDGGIFAAWNQHYPATLGVYAGDLINEAGAVIPNNGNGGYPSITIDNNGTPWVVWESSNWEFIWEGTPQSIQASYYDRDEGRWSLPYKISNDSMSVLNQTPEIDVDENGNLWVVWSGRKSEDNPWNIFMAKYENGKWSSPEIISPPGENARAPQLCAGTENDLWIAWHSGVGDEMKIKVLNYQP